VEKGPVLSDFQITQLQRRRLLSGNYKPLVFDTKPVVERPGEEPRGLEPGDRYVLAWQRASATAYEDGFVARTPRLPVWFITVRRVVRRNDGGWLVGYDVTDNRDRDLWLSHSGDYQFTARGAVDELPVAPSDEVRRKAIAERDHLARLKRHAEKQRRLAREKRERRKAA